MRTKWLLLLITLVLGIYNAIMGEIFHISVSKIAYIIVYSTLTLLLCYYLTRKQEKKSTSLEEIAKNIKERLAGIRGIGLILILLVCLFKIVSSSGEISFFYSHFSFFVMIIIVVLGMTGQSKKGKG